MPVTVYEGEGGYSAVGAAAVFSASAMALP
jgi:hypothetical protein